MALHGTEEDWSCHETKEMATGPTHIKEAGIQHHPAVYGLEPTGEKKKGSTQDVVEEDSHRETEDWRGMAATQEDYREQSPLEKTVEGPILR